MKSRKTIPPETLGKQPYVPAALKARLQDILFPIADAEDWMNASSERRTELCEEWEAREDVGGRIAARIGKKNVRQHIQFRIMRDYATARLDRSRGMVYGALGIPLDATVLESYVNPHGLCLVEYGVVTWGNAHNWKSLLMAQFERHFTLGKKVRNLGVVLFQGRLAYEEGEVEVVKAAARALGIDNVSVLTADMIHRAE
jgi:hypothetical protein